MSATEPCTWPGPRGLTAGPQTTEKPLSSSLMSQRQCCALESVAATVSGLLVPSDCSHFWQTQSCFILRGVLS